MGGAFTHSPERYVVYCYYNYSVLPPQATLGVEGICPPQHFQHSQGRVQPLGIVMGTEIPVGNTMGNSRVRVQV